MKLRNVTSAEYPALRGQDLAAVGEFYGVNPDLSITINERGLVNETLELGEDLFLTIFGARTADELEAVAEVANSTPLTLPVSRPLRGQTGYSVSLASGNALLSPRLSGAHHVGEVHTDKYPIPASLHMSLAAFFPELQTALSAAPDQLKRRLQSPSRPTIGIMPDVLPAVAKPLAPHKPAGPPPTFTHPDLVHDDLERQNILSQSGVVSGLTDLDSVRLGDSLYEFSHFMFNMVFCDPEADFATADLYIQKLAEARMLEQGDLSSIHKYLYHFAVSDIADFEDLNQRPMRGHDKAVDLDVLASQYERALYFAGRYFERQQPVELLE